MGMQPVIFVLKLFQKRDQSDADAGRQSLLWLLEALTHINQLYLRNHPETPPLYESGIRYKPEINGTEEWQDIPTNMERRYGDCEDLAAHLCAELRERGVAARPYLRWQEHRGSYRFHALVQLPNGEIEDPSLKLGMRDWSDYLRNS